MPNTKLPKYKIERVHNTNPLSQSYPASLTRLGIDKIHAKGIVGQDIKVAVLDTGKPNHIDLECNIKESFDYTGQGVEDRQYHSTHVCGTIAACSNDKGIIGVAPAACIGTFKVLNDNGFGKFSHTIKAIYEAVGFGYQIINLSLGANNISKEDYEDLMKVVEFAHAQKVLLIAASGNSGEFDIGYPAKMKKVMAIGSVDPLDVTSDFTSKGEELDFLAPGVNILSTYDNNTYAELTGTSMATPFVSGVCALMLSAGFTYEQIYNELVASCVDIYEDGRDGKSGWGIITPEIIFNNETDSEPIQSGGCINRLLGLLM